MWALRTGEKGREITSVRLGRSNILLGSLPGNLTSLASLERGKSGDHEFKGADDK